MRTNVAITGVLSLAAIVAWARDDGAQTMRAEVEAMRPARQAWREIPWMSCPLEAVAAARKAGKPILVWVFLGNPNDERC